MTTKKQYREWYLKTIDERKEYERRYRLLNADVLKERGRLYRAKNKDRIRNRARVRYLAQREKVLLRGKTPIGRFSSYRSNAKSKGRLFSLTFEQFMGFWQKDCYYCGSPIKTIGLDRIDNLGGYTIENVVSCCEICNVAKSTLGANEYIVHCQRVAERCCVRP